LKVDKIDAQLHALSPQAVLRRGYSITTMKKGGKVVRSIDQVKPGDGIITRVTDGEIESTAEDRTQPKLFD
jgi:exodeoxyribonuclease VII large subunit